LRSLAMSRKCLECPVEFAVPTAPSRRDRKKFCSLTCRNVGNAKLSAAGRGDSQRGRGDGKTYIKRNGMHEHRYLMEKKLGRKLDTDEVVHHIDGNKRNNSLENLEVITRSEHSRHHAIEQHAKVINA